MFWESCFDELIKLSDVSVNSDSDSTPNRLMRSAVGIRPWVASAAKAALPTASLAALLPVNPKISPGETNAAKVMAADIAARRLKSKLIAGAATLGAVAGLTDKYMKSWAAKHPKHEVSKKLQEQIRHEKGELIKSSAMAGDLRRTGLGGVREPPFPTEDSKRLAERILHLSQQSNRFTTHTMRKHIKKPGPSLKQIAALLR